MCESFSYRSLIAFESIGVFPLIVTVDAPFSRNVAPKVNRGIPKVATAL